MDVSIDVSGAVGASEIQYSDRCLTIEVDSGTVYLHGNPGAFRAFAELILMVCPVPRMIGRTAAAEVAQ